MSVHAGESGNCRSSAERARQHSRQSSKLSGACAQSKSIATILASNCKKRHVRSERIRMAGVHDMGLPVDDILNGLGWTPHRSNRYNPPLLKSTQGGQPRVVSTSASFFRLARRLEGVGFSDIVNIRNKILGLRASGAQVFQFEGGEPFLETPAPIKEAMTRALAENRTRYAPSSGIPELRSAIASKLSERNRIPAREEDVIVLNGGMQGLFAAFQSV